MPLMKIHIDRNQPEGIKTALADALPDLRALVCTQLDVPLSAAHLALIDYAGLPDQPQINVEVKYLARPDRTVERLRGVAEALRALVLERSGVTPAIRLTALRPDEYLAVK